jgi:hypothetical protein
MKSGRRLWPSAAGAGTAGPGRPSDVAAAGQHHRTQIRATCQQLRGPETARAGGGRVLPLVRSHGRRRAGAGRALAEIVRSIGTGPRARSGSPALSLLGSRVAGILPPTLQTSSSTAASHDVRRAPGLPRPGRSPRSRVLRPAWPPALQARVGARGRGAAGKADDRAALPLASSSPPAANLSTRRRSLYRRSGRSATRGRRRAPPTPAPRQCPPDERQPPTPTRQGTRQSVRSSSTRASDTSLARSLLPGAAHAEDTGSTRWAVIFTARGAVRTVRRVRLLLEDVPTDRDAVLSTLDAAGYGARYSPHHNPVERVWGVMKRHLANSPALTMSRRAGRG